MKKILIALALSTSTLIFAQDVMGGLVGGAIGGVIGNQFGGGNGKIATTIAGAALGSMIGSNNQREYSTNSYNRVYTDEYPTRVVYREVPQPVVYYSQPRVVYTQPRVVYVNSNHRHQYNDRQYREYARCENNHRRHEWHDED